MTVPRFSARSCLILAVMLGLALRSYHFFRTPSVWQDEAALIMCVLKLDFASMFGPLLHDEAAPPLFLVLERAIVLLLGDGLLSLRLLPFLASCASLGMLALTARKMLTPFAATIAVLLFAVSDRLLWHTGEAKSYSLDVLIAIGVGWLVLNTETWHLRFRFLILAAVAPFALWISYPACFIFGGVLLGFLFTMRTANWSDRLGYGLLATTVCVAFLILVTGPAAAQRTGPMDSCWVRHFPNWGKPLSVPLWSISSTFEVARYALLPVGQISLLLAIAGATTIMRTNISARRTVIVMSLPLLLVFLASLCLRYPYGGSRLELFMAPALCLFSAAGIPPAQSYLSRRHPMWKPVILILALIPVGQTFFRTVWDWDRPSSDQAAQFVREQIRADDRIAANFWEYEYYFRHHLDRYSHWDGSFAASSLSSQRLWLITNDFQLEKLPGELVEAGWKLETRAHFHRADVVLLVQKRHKPEGESSPSGSSVAGIRLIAPAIVHPTNTPPR